MGKKRDGFVGVWLTDAELKRLDELQEWHGMGSRSDMLRYCVRLAVEQMKGLQGLAGEMAEQEVYATLAELLADGD